MSTLNYPIEVPLQSDYDLCTNTRLSPSIVDATSSSSHWSSSTLCTALSLFNEIAIGHDSADFESRVLDVVKASEDGNKTIETILNKLERFEVKLDTLVRDNNLNKIKEAGVKHDFDMLKSLPELIVEERYKRYQYAEACERAHLPSTPGWCTPTPQGLRSAFTDASTESEVAFETETGTEAGEDDETASESSGSSSVDVDDGNGTWGGAGHKDKLFKALEDLIRKNVAKDVVAQETLTFEDKMYEEDYDFISIRNLLRFKYDDLCPYEQALYRAYYYLPSWTLDLIASVFQGEAWEWEMIDRADHYPSCQKGWAHSSDLDDKWDFDSDAAEGEEEQGEVDQEDHSSMPALEEVSDNEDDEDEVEYADLPPLVPCYPGKQLPFPGPAFTSHQAIDAIQQNVLRRRRLHAVGAAGWKVSTAKRYSAISERYSRIYPSTYGIQDCFRPYTAPTPVFRCASCPSKTHKFVSCKDAERAVGTARDHTVRFVGRCATEDLVVKKRKADNLASVLKRKETQWMARGLNKDGESELERLE